MTAIGRNIQFTLLGAAVVGATALTPAGASASDFFLVEGVTSTIEVVADGLNAPRGVFYDHDGRRVLVAEAGIAAGNTGPCGFAERGLPMCLGHTGSIFQYSEAGQPADRIVTGLPSTALQGGPSVVIGLHDLNLFEGRLTVAFGALGNKLYRESLGSGADLLGQVATVNGSGRLKAFGDVLDFEDQLHPGHIEADPFGVTVGPYGTVIANAGGPGSNKGNDLLLVAPSGEMTQLAQFPERPSMVNPSDSITSVPTSVTQGPDGAFYVGELSGAPFYPGEARVWRVVPGQQPTIHAGGFTTIIDIAFDEQGRLIVLQTGNDPFDIDMDGALIRVEHDGQRTELARAGLKNPGGVALAGPGVFYVTSKNASGGGVGQLLKVQVTG